MREKVKIENLQDSNIEDLLYVCSSKRLSDPIHQQGMVLKRQWLHKMLNTCGSCAKIAYYKGKPAAQILYYPEEADITKEFRREGVLIINCIYNPTSETQRIGIGTRLLREVILDIKMKKSCLGNKSCKFILAKAFSTGELLSMPEFYRKNGFLSTTEGGMLCLPVEGKYESVPEVRYEPLKEDRGKAIIFYGPVCQFSYPFAKRIEQIVREVLPNMKIEMINEWEKHEELMKRNWWLIVNSKPIQTFFMETEKFKEEIKEAASQNP